MKIKELQKVSSNKIGRLNKNTIKNRFREASRQATKVIFDLRYIKNNAEKVEKQIIDMFKGDGQVRHMMVIEKGGNLLDIIK